MSNLTQILIIVAIGLHALAAMFWAGSSMNLARSGGMGAEMLFPRQMMAALVATLTGGYLWSALHTGGFGPYEMVLAFGVLCAFVAAGIQGAVVGGSIRKLKAGGDEAGLRKRMAGAYRISGGLLALCLVAMVIARFI